MDDAPVLCSATHNMLRATPLDKPRIVYVYRFMHIYYGPTTIQSNRGRSINDRILCPSRHRNMGNLTRIYMQ